MCIRQKIVTVGDPTTTEITAGGLVPPDLTMLTHNEAWTAVAMATVGALLVWADTGKPNFLVVPLFLLFFFRDKKED